MRERERGRGEGATSQSAACGLLYTTHLIVKCAIKKKLLPYNFFLFFLRFGTHLILIRLEKRNWSCVFSLLRMGQTKVLLLFHSFAFIFIFVVVCCAVVVVPVNPCHFRKMIDYVGRAVQEAAMSLCLSFVHQCAFDTREFCGADKLARQGEPGFQAHQIDIFNKRFGNYIIDRSVWCGKIVFNDW